VRSFLEGQRYTPIAVVSVAARLARYIRRERIELVHSFLYPANVIGSLAARMTRRPLIISVRDAPQRLPVLERAAYGVMGRLGDAVVVNSYAGRDLLAAQAGVPTGKIAVHYNGVDFVSLQGDDCAELRRRYGIPGDAGVVGTVGRIDRKKRYELLLWAVSALREVSPQVYVVLVGGAGEGDGVMYEEELRALRGRLGLEGRVILAGAQCEVGRFLSMFDLFALSSRYEGTPNALLEAMAVGVPVLTTDVGDAGRIVRAAAGGLVLPPEPRVWAAQIHALLGDRRLRAAMGANGRAYVRARFGLERLARETEALWERLLARRGEGVCAALPESGTTAAAPPSAASCCAA
jgi:glycosyltransferase involved in cell wall biosynthesis